MKLYHGTSARFLDNILLNGLRPRGKGKGNWKHTVDSNPELVYLSDSYAPYFANCATNMEDDCVVIEIESDRVMAYMLPDEDALEQVNRGRDGIPGDMQERTRHYKRTQLDHLGSDNWRISLMSLGTPQYKNMTAVLFGDPPTHEDPFGPQHFEVERLERYKADDGKFVMTEVNAIVETGAA